MIKASIRLGVGFAVAAFAFAASSAHAQTVTFYFTLKSDTTGSTPISTANIGSKNATLDLSVWVKTSSAFNALSGESFFQFDRTTSDSASGAVLSDKKIGVVGDSTNALTPSGKFNVTNALAFDVDSASPRYYGIVYDFGVTGNNPINVNTPTKLYDISIYNKNLATGNTYNVRLVDNGDTNELQNNYLVNGDGTKLHDGATLRLTAVPEPATMAVLSLGLIPILRRRRRSN